MEQEERLQKIIAAAGLASRRKAEQLIQQGRVTVNGKVITQLGTKANPQRDHIKVDGKAVHESDRKVYILLNKPKRVISTLSDPQGRTKVTDLVDIKGKIYPAGRLDYNTEGLILLTNDGEFSKTVASAGMHLLKVYRVKVKSTPTEASLTRLREGVRLKGGIQLAPCRIIPIKRGNNSWFEVTLTQGKNRQIRRMVRKVGNRVSHLNRIRISNVRLGNLPSGGWRHLSNREKEALLSCIKD